MQLITTNGEEKDRVLKSNPYFSDLSPEILSEVLSGMRLYRFEKNEAIFWEGDESPSLNMIRQGSTP